MKKYTFEELTDIEFQELINDLLEKKFGWVIERFKPGKDGGIDGRFLSAKGIGVIQTKHYRGSGLSQLLKKIRIEECKKAKALNPNRYILATSLNLNPEDKNKIIQAFSGIPLSTNDIFGNDEVNAMLREFPDVHKTYYKLWSDSADSLNLFLHPEINTRENALKNRLKKINFLFVETEDFKPALDLLNSTHVVVISGEPGIGKTTLAEYLCQVHMKEGYRIDVIEGDITQYPINLSDPEKKVLLYFDDFLGANYFAAISGNHDSSIVRLIDQVRNEPNKRFILTSRANIINKAEIFSQSFRSFGLTKRQYVLKINRYSRITKARILYNHLWHSDLDGSKKKEITHDNFFIKVIDHRNFNPRLIAFSLTSDGQKDGSLSKSLYEHLEKPEQIWDHCYTVQLDEQARIIVKLCVASGGTVDENTLSKAYEKGLIEYRFVPTSNQPTDFEYTLRLVCNSLLIKNLTEDKVTYSHFNPSVSDYVIGKINTFTEARRLISSLDSVRVVMFFNDLVHSKKMKRTEAIALSEFLLNRYMNHFDDKFLISVDLALFLEDETPLLKIGIEEFCAINFSEKTELSNYRIALILEKAISFGVSESTFLNILEQRDFELNRLTDLYSIISENGSFQEAKAIIKNNIVDLLVEDIDQIISESDQLNECDYEEDAEKYADNCIDDLSDEYPMLEESDIERLKHEYSRQALMDVLHDRWNSSDNEVDSETRQRHFDRITEDVVINEMFRNFENNI
jgi:adenylate kinase family enzyme